MQRLFLIGAAGLLLGLAGFPNTASGFNTAYPTPQIQGLHGWIASPLFSVGEALPSSHHATGYLPAGKLDGIGAERLDRQTVRAYINHELSRGSGSSYLLRNTTELTGARISYVDIDIETHTIKGSGPAYHRVFDRHFLEVRRASQINEAGDQNQGFNNLCSGQLVEQGSLNFEDTIFITHEESETTDRHPHGGSIWALDTHRAALHAVPAAGRGKWENTAALDIPGERIALIMGDDKAPAPLWLYIGTKHASIFKMKHALPRSVNPPRHDFLNRNGLLVGELFYFVPDPGLTAPSRFFGTGNVMQGYWRRMAVLDESRAGQPGFDDVGYKGSTTLRSEAFAGGAFPFARPEDVSANPFAPRQAVMAATGHGNRHHGSDDWGTLYLIDVDFMTMRGQVTILYDSHDAGGGQFSGPDYGLRNPDNVDWGDDGLIYIQEDRATEGHLFGGTSGREASIWQFNPLNSDMRRIAEVDRSVVVPNGSTDQHPEVRGTWETTGILDVTTLFDSSPTVFELARPRHRILLGAVQAHTIRDGILESKRLVEGGQLVILKKMEETFMPRTSMSP